MPEESDDDSRGGGSPRALYIVLGCVAVLIVAFVTVLILLMGSVSEVTQEPQASKAPANFRLVEEEQPSSDGRCPSGAAWRRFEDECLRLGAGFSAHVTAELTERDVGPVVTLVIQPPGHKTFASFTREHQGKRFALLRGGDVLLAPAIEAPITGEKAEISGVFTRPDAERLVARINGE